MAFQFIPPFEEGDKQTNPETGVEYIFTGGAWRPLGPAIDSQFDDLDERYVQKAGDTIHGKLEFDHGDDTPANLWIRPNVSDVSTSVYQLNGGALRFRSIPAEDTNDGSTTHLAMGKNDADGSPETYIYHLQDPQDELWAANKRYVDGKFENVDVSGYLPLTGGTLTGTLNTDSIIKSTRTSGYSLEIENNGVQTAFLHSNGNIKGQKLMIESHDLTESTGRAFEVKGRMSNGTISKNFFYMYNNASGTPSAINYDGKMDSDKNIVTKSFVDGKVPGSFTFESGALYYNT